SIRFLNPSTLAITGIFRSKGKYPVTMGENEIAFGPLRIASLIALHLQGSPLFEWYENDALFSKIMNRDSAYCQLTRFKDRTIMNVNVDETVFPMMGFAGSPDHDIKIISRFMLLKRTDSRTQFE